MLYCKFFHKIKKGFVPFTVQLLLVAVLLCKSYSKAEAQECPPNIDFETGTFEGWICYIGSVSGDNAQNAINIFPSGGPVSNRHTMYTINTGAGVDPYGGFPVNCPNGSGHSIRLGNDQAGTEAEGISYQFTIPANRNTYSLIYHYAVVFQDPNHLDYQQPRMEIEILNVTDNSVINCSSFTFIPYGTILPGFFESTTNNSGTPVWCKDWSAVSVNLDKMAGKTIRLFFKTADCTFRRHFGYAYIDVNSECNSEFVGAAYCPDDTLVNVVAPYGYQQYVWYNNNNFNSPIGSKQTLTLKPPPPPGTTVAVAVTPYAGYGCPDTLYAKLIDTLTIAARAGPDTISCNHVPVQLGANSKPGHIYSWSPAAGLSNPNISNPVANPNVTTTYILTVRHDGGGCLSMDTVTVKASIIDTSIRLVGKATYCLGNNDSAVLHVNPTDGIQWYNNNSLINGANQTEYKVTRSGTYYAMLSNNDGCNIATQKQVIFIDKPKPGINYPIKYALEDLPLELEARRFGDSVLWSPGIYLDNPKSYTPVFTSSEEQLYTIQIKTSTGCITVDTQLVKTVKNVEIYVPTAFSPNNDGLNDFLKPLLRGVKQLRYFRVYNRWGQLLYESKTEQPGWNGTLHGVLQPTQVVTWIAEGIGVDNKVYARKGISTLIR